MGWGFPSSQPTRPEVTLFRMQGLGGLFSRIRLLEEAERLLGE